VPSLTLLFHCLSPAEKHPTDRDERPRRESIATAIPCYASASLLQLCECPLVTESHCAPEPPPRSSAPGPSRELYTLTLDALRVAKVLIIQKTETLRMQRFYYIRWQLQFRRCSFDNVTIRQQDPSESKKLGAKYARLGPRDELHRNSKQMIYACIWTSKRKKYSIKNQTD